MRRQQHGHAACLSVADDVEQLDGRLRIETGGRLVENRDLRILHQDLGEAETLAHAAGEGLDALVGDIRSPTCASEAVILSSRSSRLKPDQARGVAQIVGRGEIVVKADRSGM